MICSLDEAVAERERARAQGFVCAVANGAFDLLHVGHLRYLAAAKELAGPGGLLVVGLNSDASVRASKGPARPIIPQAERAELVDSLKWVDLVVLFDEVDAKAFLRALHPDIHVKGTDYTADSVPERALVESLGGRTVIAGDSKDHSTTDAIARIKALD